MFRDDLIAELAAMTHQERMQLWELAWQSSAGQPKRVVTGCRAALCCNAGEKLNVPRVARAFRKAEPDMGVEEAILTARELVAEGELSEVVYFHNQYASLEDAYVYSPRMAMFDRVACLIPGLTFTREPIYDEVFEKNPCWPGPTA